MVKCTVTFCKCLLRHERGKVRADFPCSISSQKPSMLLFAFSCLRNPPGSAHVFREFMFTGCYLDLDMQLPFNIQLMTPKPFSILLHRVPSTKSFSGSLTKLGYTVQIVTGLQQLLQVEVCIFTFECSKWHRIQGGGVIYNVHQAATKYANARGVVM